MRTVREVMTTEVFSVAQETDYRNVAETLLERQVSALPVTDGDGRVVGVVSEEDLLHKEEFAGGDYRPPLRARLRTRIELLDSMTTIEEYERRFAHGPGVRELWRVARSGSGIWVQSVFNCVLPWGFLAWAARSIDARTSSVARRAPR